MNRVVCEEVEHHRQTDDIIMPTAVRSYCVQYDQLIPTALLVNVKGK